MRRTALILLIGTAAASSAGRARAGHLDAIHAHAGKVAACLGAAHDHLNKMKAKGQERKQLMAGAFADGKKVLQGHLADKKAKHKAKAHHASKPKAAPAAKDCNCTPPAPFAPAAPIAPAYPAVGPTPQAIPSSQSVVAAPGCGGPCYPGGQGPCLPPYVAPQWIVPPCPTAATPTPQAPSFPSSQFAPAEVASPQLAPAEFASPQLASSQFAPALACPPSTPACCGQPSFYCPPMLLPAPRAPKLAMGGKVPMMRAIRIPAAVPSSQYPAPFGGVAPASKMPVPLDNGAAPPPPSAADSALPTLGD